MKIVAAALTGSTGTAAKRLNPAADGTGHVASLVGVLLRQFGQLCFEQPVSVIDLPDAVIEMPYTVRVF